VALAILFSTPMLFGPIHWPHCQEEAENGLNPGQIGPMVIEGPNHWLEVSPIQNLNK
jgi:hypothetical protein